jgi:hypothetical protein
MGEGLLLVIGVGLAGYAIWRMLDAITDAEGKGGDAKGLARRIGSAGEGTRARGTRGRCLRAGHRLE